MRNILNNSSLFIRNFTNRQFAKSNSSIPHFCFNQKFGASTKFSTSSLNDIKNKSLTDSCKTIGDLLNISDTIEIRQKLAYFFRMSDSRVKDKYNNNADSFISQVEAGMKKGISFATDKQNAKTALISTFLAGISQRDGKMMWSFCNITSRASHLFGAPEDGGLTFEQVYQVANFYNRYGFSGIGGGEENSTFLLLCHDETREQIENKEFTPKDALKYAEELKNDPNAQNPLSKIAAKVFDKNLKDVCSMNLSS